MQVLVRDNNVDQALRVLKKKMQREGVFREMKLRRNYEKPSERRAREKAEAVRRARKLERKRAERDGEVLGGGTGDEGEQSRAHLTSPTAFRAAEDPRPGLQSVTSAAGAAFEGHHLLKRMVCTCW